jgi:hypothetical protein
MQMGEDQSRLEIPETAREPVCLEALTERTPDTVAVAGAALRLDRERPNQDAAVEDILVGYNRVATLLRKGVQIKRGMKSERGRLQGVGNQYKWTKVAQKKSDIRCGQTDGPQILFQSME